MKIEKHRNKMALRDEKRALKVEAKADKLAAIAEKQEAEKSAKSSMRSDRDAVREERNQIRQSQKDAKLDVGLQGKVDKLRRREESARRRAAKRSLKDELGDVKSAEKERIAMMRRAQKLGLNLASATPVVEQYDGHLWEEEAGLVPMSASDGEKIFDWRAADIPEPLPERLTR